MSQAQPLLRSDLEGQLLDELQAMATYALGLGIRMPDSVVRVVMEAQSAGSGPRDVTTLIAIQNAHEALARLLAPATPEAIALIDSDAHRRRRFDWLPNLGPVPLVRELTIAGLIFLVGLIGFGLSSKVSRDSGGILDSSGTDLLLNLLFVLCAAGLGAVFAALFKVSRYISARTYDPVYESSYWVNIVLGLIGGLLLAELILEAFDSGDPDDPTGVPLARPLLALVGGFSAKVVFQILNRLVDAVGSIFKGDASELVAANTEAARAKLINQQTEDRVKLSTKLVQLQQSLNTGATPDQISAAVGGMLDELLPFDTGTDPADTTGGSGAGNGGAVDTTGGSGAGNGGAVDTTGGSGAGNGGAVDTAGGSGAGDGGAVGGSAGGGAGDSGDGGSGDGGFGEGAVDTTGGSGASDAGSGDESGGGGASDASAGGAGADFTDAARATDAAADTGDDGDDATPAEDVTG